MLPNILHRKKKIIEYEKPLDATQMFFCRDARLVYINGNGSIVSTTCRASDNSTPELYMSQITFNGTPLISINSPYCPTCESLIATGCGMDKTDSAELKVVSEAFNEDYAGFDTAVNRMLPLLSLLQSGLYVLADTLCYPTDGDGRFFWNVPNDFTSNPATAAVWLNDEDYEYTYVHGFPAYLYPTQNTDCYNEERVQHYIDRFQMTDARPRAIAYHCGEFLSFLLDGHHKACAAAALQEPLPCLVILPFEYYSYTTANQKTVPSSLVFGPFALNITEIPKKYCSLYSKKPAGQLAASLPAKQCPNALTHRIWENKYLASALTYPRVRDLAIMSLTGIADPSDEIIEECLHDLSEDNRKKLRSILLLLDLKNDSRLKNTALSCAENAYTSELKLEAFKSLFKIKNDDEITDFFINWIVYDTDPHSLFAKIANAYLDAL